MRPSSERRGSGRRGGGIGPLQAEIGRDGPDQNGRGVFDRRHADFEAADVESRREVIGESAVMDLPLHPWRGLFRDSTEGQSACDQKWQAQETSPGHRIEDISPTIREGGGGHREDQPEVVAFRIWDAGCTRSSARARERPFLVLIPPERHKLPQQDVHADVFRVQRAAEVVRDDCGTAPGCRGPIPPDASRRATQLGGR
jgi:hypothetical protein